MLYAPIVIIAIFSFTESKVLGNWTGFSTELYQSLFSGGVNNSLIDAIQNTFIIAFVAATVSTLLGTVAAIGINDLRYGKRKAVNFVNNIPILNPDIITGISLLLLFNVFRGWFDFDFGMGTLLISHITFNVPYVILSVMPKLKQMDYRVYEAALDLGCNPSQAFFKVVVPEIMPGIISGFLMALTFSIDDFIISYFNSGHAQTLPVAIYAMARRRVSPEMYALSTIMFLVILTILFAVNIKSIKDEKKVTR